MLAEFHTFPYHFLARLDAKPERGVSPRLTKQMTLRATWLLLVQHLCCSYAWSGREEMRGRSRRTVPHVRAPKRRRCGDFEAQVREKRGNAISATIADAWLQTTDQIETAIGCTSNPV